MGKHRARMTIATAAREDIVKERFEELADRIDSGVSDNPHTIWTSKHVRHSTIPNEGTLWHYINGDWISDAHIKELEAMARRVNPGRRNNHEFDRLSYWDRPVVTYPEYPYGAWTNYDQERNW
jgi:hypothetical protein